MHPHPGFPRLARLDDVCGACAADDVDDTLMSLAAKKEGEVRLRARSLQLTGAGWTRLAAITAAALIATAALCRRRGG